MGYGSGVALSYGVGHRCGSDLMLSWLWYRLAAVALIGPLTWEPPYAVDVALKKHTHTHKVLFFFLVTLNEDNIYKFLRHICYLQQSSDTCILLATKI